MGWAGIHSNDASTYGQYVHERRRGRWPTLLVGALAGIDPVTVDVNGFREVIYRCLKIFQADPTGDSTCIPLPIHFDFARPLVIAERAVELRLQGLDVLAFWRWLALAPASSHRSRSSTSWSRTNYCCGIKRYKEPAINRKGAKGRLLSPRFVRNKRLDGWVRCSNCNFVKA